MVEAAWELHARLQALSPPADGGGAAGGTAGDGDENRLPPAMASMAAVAAQRQRLQGLQRGFLEKAGAYLQQELGRVADGALERLAAQQGALRVRPADHASLRRRAAALAPLLEVVGVLRPAASVAPREAYCQAVNGLLRREVHSAAAELKRMAAAADAGGAQEPDLFDRAAAADSAGWVGRAGCLGLVLERTADASAACMLGASACSSPLPACLPPPCSTLQRISAAPGAAGRARPGADLSASYKEAGKQGGAESRLAGLTQSCMWLRCNRRSCPRHAGWGIDPRLTRWRTHCRALLPCRHHAHPRGL